MIAKVQTAVNGQVPSGLAERSSTLITVTLLMSEGGPRGGCRQEAGGT